MRWILRRALLVPVALGLLLGLLAGCELTPEDLDGWTSKDQGTRQLAALLPDPERSMAVRTEAARILVRKGAVLELTDGLTKSEPAQRTRIANALAPYLEQLLESPNESEQVHAKEAIYFMGGYLSEELRQPLAAKLIDWAVEDFPGRYDSGKTTLGQALPALGTQVAVPLLRLLRSGVEPENLTRTLLALDSVEVDEAVARILAEQASSALPAIPIPLAKAVLLVRRPELTPMLLEVAGDQRVSHQIREHFLDHIHDCKGEGVLDGLTSLLTDPDFRWAAAQMMLNLGRLEGLELLVAGLPAEASYAQDDEELFYSIDTFCDQGIAAMKAKDEEVEQTLLRALPRASWPGKLLALHCLGRHGSSESLRALQAATRYHRKLGGWKPADTTLGEVARASLEAIRSR